jgi:hypothetical protein
MQLTPQDNQLMSKHRILSFKPQLRLEWRGQDGQNETEQPDHSANLGDSITASTRIRFSVHTALTGIGLTSLREAISSGGLKAKKHGRRTIILPDDLRVWLKTLPDAASRLKKAPLRRGFYFSAVLRSRLTVGRSGK